MKRSKSAEMYISAFNEAFSSSPRIYRDSILNEQNGEAKFKIGDKVSFHDDSSAIPGKKIKKVGTVEKIEGDTLYIKGTKSKYGIVRYKKKAYEVMSEEFAELDEAKANLADTVKFSDIMKKAISAHEKGDPEGAKYHLNKARIARVYLVAKYTKKSPVIVKIKDLLDKYEELRDYYDME